MFGKVFGKKDKSRTLSNPKITAETMDAIQGKPHIGQKVKRFKCKNYFANVVMLNNCPFFAYDYKHKHVYFWTLWFFSSLECPHAKKMTCDRTFSSGSFITYAQIKISSRAISNHRQHACEICFQNSGIYTYTSFFFRHMYSDEISWRVTLVSTALYSSILF